MTRRNSSRMNGTLGGTPSKSGWRFADTAQYLTFVRDAQCAESKASGAQSREDSEDRSQTGARDSGRGRGVCAFCQNDDGVMMCPLCSCRACYGKQDPSLALLCEVKYASVSR